MTFRTVRPSRIVSAALLLAAVGSSPGAAAAGDGGAPSAAGVALSADGRAAGSLSAATLAALPRRTVIRPAEAGHDGTARRYEGPTLWAMLERAGLTGDPHDAARRVVVLRGRDGYGAVIAEGEIAPAFENKAVIVADTADGRALGADHLRVVVPGDGRGGRSVHDLAAVEVDTVAPAKPGGTGMR